MVGPPATPANPEELQYLIGAWESMDLSYRLQYTADGHYSHVKASPLLKAMYGFDPLTGKMYSWGDYSAAVIGTINDSSGLTNKPRL